MGSQPTTAWPYSGENYNGFHPPLYFIVAGFGGNAIAALTGTDFVTGARWISGLLVAVGIAALYLAIRKWRVGPVAAFAGALLALATPAVAAAAVIVHNDAITPLAGAAAVWLLGRVFLDRRLGWVMPSLAMLAVAWTRVMSAAGLLTVTVMLFIVLVVPRAGGLSARDRPAVARLVAGQVGALMLGYGGWTVWQNSRTPEGYVPAISGFSTDLAANHGVAEILRTVLDPYGLTDPVTDWYLQPSLESSWTTVWSSALYWVFLLLPVAVLVLGARSGAGRMLFGALAVGPAVAGGVVQARELLTSGAFFRVLSGRYALSLVPLYAASAAWAFDRRIVRWLLLAFALAGYLTIVTGPFAS